MEGLMSNFSDQQDQDRRAQLAENKQELEDQWKAHVTAVLSHTRIDPKYKNQPFEPFQQFDGEPTDAQVALLKQSSYAGDWRQFHGLWKSQPEDAYSSDRGH
jgi:hypothetical protein